MLSLISLPVNSCNATMASRRSSDKTPDSNNQIVKIQPASPINTVNRFTTLWYQSHSFLAGDSVVVFLCLLFVSTRNFGVQLSCPLLTVVGATLVVK